MAMHLNQAGYQLGAKHDPKDKPADQDPKRRLPLQVKTHLFNEGQRRKRPHPSMPKFKCLEKDGE